MAPRHNTGREEEGGRKAGVGDCESAFEVGKRERMRDAP